MKTDLRLAFSKRFLVSLFLSSVLLRLFFLFVYLPDKPSEFGPDEGTYGALADYVANNLPVQEFPTYGPGLYNQARTLIVPSSVLVRMGVNPLDSVRFVSSLYGICALFFFVLSIIAIQKLNSKTENLTEFTLSYANKFVLFLYAFFPSYFLWSNLGLRESSSQFFLLATFYFCIKLISAKSSIRWIIISITPIFLMLAFGSRPQTAIVFTVCALVFSLVVLWKVRDYSLAFVLLAGFSLGQAFTTTPTVQASEVFVAREVTGAETKTPQPTQSAETKTPQPTQSAETKTPQPTQSAETKTPQPTQSAETKTPKPQENFELSKYCEFENQIVIINDDEYECIASKKYSVIERKPIEQIKTQVLTTQILEYKRNVNRLNASSALSESSCNFNFKGVVQQIICNIQELPYRLTAFLIRPFPILDSGSSFQNLAGLENILWLYMICLGVLRVVRYWQIRENHLVIFFLFSFLICFSTAAALYEGNLGTAFRHKSTILWTLLLILILTNKSTNLRSKDLSALYK